MFGSRGLLMCSALVALAGACTNKAPSRACEDAATTEGRAAELYTLPGLDHGLLQSPVNILSSRAADGMHEIAVNYHDAEPEYLDNKGTTIEVDFVEGSSITFDGREYQLKQLHFHTPSEHQIDGITYPMEMHVVNVMDSKDPPQYLVLSFLYRMGSDNAFIASFLDEVPTTKGGESLVFGKVMLAVREAQRDPKYFHYRGSLTTPPYTETVDWLVAKEIAQASPEQIRRINMIVGNNARHVQALSGRTVDE